MDSHSRLSLWQNEKPPEIGLSLHFWWLKVGGVAGPHLGLALASWPPGTDPSLPLLALQALGGYAAFVPADVRGVVGGRRVECSMATSRKDRQLDV